MFSSVVIGIASTAPAYSLAATLGYVAFLVGPPVLGFAGDEVGLRAALTIPLVLVVVAAVLAPRIGRERPAPADPRATAPELAPTD